MDGIDSEEMVVSSRNDSNFFEDEEQSEETASHCTETLTVVCRKVFNSWVIEFELKDKETTYTLSVDVDKEFQQIPKVNYEIDPFSEDLTFSLQVKPVLSCFKSSKVKLDGKREIPELNHKLFSFVFGSDATLSNSDVFLFGLPDGRVFWWPSNHIPDSAREPFFLCHLEQPVIGITSAILNEQDSGIYDCLLFIGQYGKIITCIAGNKMRPVYTTDFIIGPVTSCCTWKNCLYHTNAAGELWQIRLSLDEETHNDTVLLKANRLPVVSSCTVTLKTYQEDGDRCVLCYQTTDGESRMLDIDSVDKLCADAKGVGGSQSEQISFLVNALQEASSKLQEIQHRTQLQKHCLENLTGAFWLLYGDHSNVNITCRISRIEGQARNYAFDVTVLGLSLDRSANWHVVCSLSEKDPESPHPKSCKSQPIERDIISLHMESSVSLESRHDTVMPPLVLECGLVLNQNIPDSHESRCIYVLLKTFSLDEWDFVVATDDPKSYRPLDDVGKAIRDAAKKRGFTGDERESAFCHEGEFSVSVLMSSVTKAEMPCLEDVPVQDAFLMAVLSPLRDLSSPAYCFGHAIQVVAEVEKDILILRLKCENLGAAIRLRSALARRIQNLLDGKRRKGEQGIEISQELQSFVNECLSELRKYGSQEMSTKKLMKLYQDFRNGFSCHLPFV